MNAEGNQQIAAAKSGMDAKTVRKYRHLGQVPSELPAACCWLFRKGEPKGAPPALRSCIPTP
jgi:hypothetical protein